MASIDIREQPVEEITKIVFSANGLDYTTAVCLERRDQGTALAIVDEVGEQVWLESREQVENLIKALNKAIELGWVE